MASETKTVSAPRIIKGPPRMDLLEALFFDRKKVLTFDLNKRVGRFGGQTQLFATLFGIIPTDVPQSNVLILQYYESGRSPVRMVAVYDDHNRSGWFTWADTLDELLAESWYDNGEDAWYPGRPPVTIVVTPRSQMGGHGDYHAQIDKQPGRWSSGTTPEEAIGNLVNAHVDQFRLPSDIDLKDLDHEELGEMVLDDGRTLGIKVRR